MSLQELLTKPEDKTLEFKRDLSSPLGVLKTLVAFANTAGGTLIIGVEDGTRHVKGIDNPLNVEERLANLISDSIHPKIIPDIEIASWRNTNVIKIEVFPAPSGPYFLKKSGPEKGIFVRVGSTNRQANASIVDEFQRLVKNETFDEQPMVELSSEDIDFRVASELFKPHRKISTHDLKTLKIVTCHRKKWVPTVGGVLLFGREREKYFPDAWIKMGRFLGTNRETLVDHAEINDFPLLAIERIISFIKRNIRQSAAIKEIYRHDIWEYPISALREAVINALVHADYSQKGSPIRISLMSDRIEVDNPGTLPLGLTIEDIKQGISKLRNRVLGRVFNELGLIEQWGSGIQRIIAACQKAGLREPLFEEVGFNFRVTLYSTVKQSPQTDEIDRKILGYLQEKGGLSTKMISRFISLSPRATRSRMIALADKGLVVEVGSSPKDPQKKYYISELHRYP